MWWKNFLTSSTLLILHIKVHNQSFIAFPLGRRTSFLHSNWLAALRSVSLRLQSLNQKTLTDYHWCNGVFYTDSFFWFFRLIYILIFIWFGLCLGRTRGISDGSWCDGKCEGKCEGRKFTLTAETTINRAFQAESEGVRVKKEKKLFLFILHFISSRKRSRLQIRLESLCIENKR